MFWYGDLKRRDHMRDLAIDGKIILKSILNKYGLGAWTGLIWLKIGSSSGA
jgi:hypothetical protein